MSTVKKLHSRAIMENVYGCPPKQPDYVQGWKERKLRVERAEVSEAKEALAERSREWGISFKVIDTFDNGRCVMYERDGYTFEVSIRFISEPAPEADGDGFDD